MLIVLQIGCVFGCAGRSSSYSAPDARSQVPPDQRYEFTQIHMGVAVRIVLYADDDELAHTAAKAGFSAFSHIDSVASDWRSNSELMRLCDRAGSGAIPVSDELLELLVLAQHVSDDSGGAFDCTIGPVSHLWRDAINAGAAHVDQNAIARARTFVGMELIQIDQTRRTVTLAKQGMVLDLGGIAKGYAADRALQAMRDTGVGSAIVDASGDIAIGDPPPGATAWRVHVATGVPGSEETQLLVSNCAVATSGSAHQHVVIDNIDYSHIVSPKSGRATQSALGACVVAKNGAAADAWATAACVLADENAIQLRQRTLACADVDLCIVERIDSDGVARRSRITSAP